jgi:2-polyprenyl-3-methyl-5-hydroxy-6-metoxy-1,4-benzoquinol methylase
VDRWTGPVDLEEWVPPVRWDWFACLEVLEHLRDPRRLLDAMLDAAVRGVVVTTPNPAVVDVLAMDPTHRTPISREQLAQAGLYTSLHNLYGADQDGICGVWYREGLHLVERDLVPVYAAGES